MIFYNIGDGDHILDIFEAILIAFSVSLLADPKPWHSLETLWVLLIPLYSFLLQKLYTIPYITRVG